MLVVGFNLVNVCASTQVAIDFAQIHVWALTVFCAFTGIRIKGFAGHNVGGHG
jgi:hypothetical protein